MANPRNLWEALSGATNFAADNLLDWISGEQQRKRQMMLDAQNQQYRQQVLGNQDRAFEYRQQRDQAGDQRYAHDKMFETLLMADKNKTEAPQRAADLAYTQARTARQNAQTANVGANNVKPVTPSAARGDLNDWLKKSGQRLGGEVYSGLEANLANDPDASIYALNDAGRQGAEGLYSYLQAHPQIGDDELRAKADSNRVISRGGYGTNYGYNSPQGLAERSAASNMAGRFNPEVDQMGREIFSDWDQMTDDQRMKALQIWSQGR